jgi:hypothetical protein
MSDWTYLGLSLIRIQTAGCSTYEANIHHTQAAQATDCEPGNLPDSHRRDGLWEFRVLFYLPNPDDDDGYIAFATLTLGLKRTGDDY